MARPKSGNALSPAEKQRRYRARLAAKAAAKAARAAEARAAETRDLDGMAPKRLAELIWERRGRKAALAVRTRISQLAKAEDDAKATAQARLREAARKAESAAHLARPTGATLARMTLGLAANEPLSAATIAAAYRAMVRKAHPDAGGSGDGATMAQITHARDMLLEAVGWE